MEIEAVRGGGGGGGRGAFLVWEDLSVVLPNFKNNVPTRRLLNGLSGFAEPGRIMAIMGPFGSGKSTLLDTLAGSSSLSSFSHSPWTLHMYYYIRITDSLVEFECSVLLFLCDIWFATNTV